MGLLSLLLEAPVRGFYRAAYVSILFCIPIICLQSTLPVTPLTYLGKYRLMVARMRTINDFLKVEYISLYARNTL